MTTQTFLVNKFGIRAYLKVPREDKIQEYRIYERKGMYHSRKRHSPRWLKDLGSYIIYGSSCSHPYDFDKDLVPYEVLVK